MTGNLDEKTVLVTGGAGYIGSHACKALHVAGYKPVVYDNLGNGHREAVRWGPLEEGDIADRARLEMVLRVHRPAAVMHFAAFIEAGESVIDPGKFFANNTCGSLNLIRTLCDFGIHRLLFSSTAAVYGEPQQCPIAETHPRQPINPYGVSKWMVERMLADLGAAHGLQHTALRYFNAAGADPGNELGESHDPESHLIPLVLQAALGERSHITLFGTDYDTDDGSCVRDYIHVSDLVDAHLLALKALEAGRAAPAYNLGNGKGFSVRTVIKTARQVTGRQIATRMGPRRPGDPAVLVADAGKAKRELGWKPRHADLSDIVATAWQWARRNTKQVA